MSNKITVKTNTKVIEVNDAGETISLPLGDQAFTNGLIELMRVFSKSAGEVSTAVEEINDGADAAAKADGLSAVANLNLRICTEMKAKTDALFADEVCRKVFGDIVPSLSAFSDFFDQLSPFIAEYGKERFEACKKSVEKYTKKYQNRKSDGRK